MERMRKVAEGVIAAPPIARQDAAAAIAVYDRIAHARDLWDGTIDDLAGYLRMMGSYIIGFTQMMESMPENKDLMLEFERMGGTPIIHAFLAGDTDGLDVTFDTGSPEENARARQQYASSDPTKRDVVSACALVNAAWVFDIEDDAHKPAALYKLALAKLGYSQFNPVRQPGEPSFEEHQALSEEDRGALAERRLSYQIEVQKKLQQALHDRLGFTRKDLDLDDLLFYLRWRSADAFFKYAGSNPASADFKPNTEKGGMAMLSECITDRHNFLPAYCDQAMHMISMPSLYTAREFIGRIHLGLQVLMTDSPSPPWSQLLLQCLVMKGVMAGGFPQPWEGLRSSTPPMLREFIEINIEPEHFDLFMALAAKPDNGVYHFTADQMEPNVQRAEELLDRMRPWLGDNAEFKVIEKDVQGWRENYITGKGRFEQQKAIPMSTVPAGGGGKTCATCGISAEKLKVCSACRQVWYCNAKCQKAGWKAHKKVCIAARKNA